jgi:hypothetical protein
METVRETPIELIQDDELEKDAGSYFGKYLGTFVSARGQVRADLFDDSSGMTAYVSFPTGLNASSVEDRYVNELDSYAQSQGFAQRFQIVFSE